MSQSKPSTFKVVELCDELDENNFLVFWDNEYVLFGSYIVSRLHLHKSQLEVDALAENLKHILFKVRD